MHPVLAFLTSWAMATVSSTKRNLRFLCLQLPFVLQEIPLNNIRSVNLTLPPSLQSGWYLQLQTMHSLI